MTSRIVATIVCELLLCAPLMASANEQPSFDGMVGNLGVSMVPAYPAPGDTVHMKIVHSALDLTRAEILWLVNGEEIVRGIGKTEADIVAGPDGSTTIIDIVARDPSANDSFFNRSESEKIIIRPAAVDLLWQTDSYVPPFYDGRARPGENSRVRAYALAHFILEGALVMEKDIVYNWYRNNALIAVASGLGKSRADFPGPLLFGSDTIRVVAESFDKKLQASAEVRLSSENPRITFYEQHPLFGVLFHRALTNGTRISESETTIFAVPYFAHIISPADSDLIYRWLVNDGPVAVDPKRPHIITITAPNYTGPAIISLSIEHAQDFLLQAEATLRLVFEGNQSTFFGLDLFNSTTTR